MHNTERLRLLGASLLLVLASTGPAWPYDVLGADWSYQAHPMSNKLVVCERGGPPGASAAIRKAAEGWTYAKFRFAFDADRCIDHPTVRDGVSYVYFDKIADPTIAAHTDWRNEPPGTARMAECDLRFSSERSWFTGDGQPTAVQDDLVSTALHELGHCLGLGETAVANMVMSSVLPKGQTRRRLGSDDVAGRNAIYGTP